MILIYINNNFEANITHLCPMSNGLMLSFSPADRRALWLASDNSCYNMQWLYGRKAFICARLTGVNESHAIGSPVKLDRSHCTALIRVPSCDRSRLWVGTYTQSVLYNLKPLWSGMGEVVPARTSPTLHPPSPPTML